MGIATTFCRASCGLDAPLIRVETSFRPSGTPKWQMVGLPETAVKESRERVITALKSCRFQLPPGRILINLAPAGMKKSGGRFDLAIAIGVLAASGQIPADDLHQIEFAGELGLNGDVRSIYAALPFAIATTKTRRTLIIARDNQHDVALVDDATIYTTTHLLAVTQHLLGECTLPQLQAQKPKLDRTPVVDMSEVHGQTQAKKALEIAAAGGHHMLMIGPPGTGKTMLSQCLPGILPDLAKPDALEVAAIRSLCRIANHPDRWLIPPFQAPHHTASHVALVGGGSPPHPGEISRAHRGVLFLDELPEFQRSALEALREPIESGMINIARANHHSRFPARFQLIAAMNPCPCGQAGNPQQPCRCTPDQILRYQHKISGPLLDRIDLHTEVPPLPRGALTRHETTAENSATIRARVQAARDRQLLRQNQLNRHLSGRALLKVCDLKTPERDLLDHAIDKLHLSTRSYQNILRVARTIADLANAQRVSTIHLSEALCYRSFDKGLPS